MSRFELTRLADYSDESLLAEMRRVASLVPSGSLTKAVFRRHAHVSHSTVSRRFGGWQEALAAAGLGDRYSGQSVTQAMKAQVGRSLNDEQVLDQMRAVAKKLGRESITVEELSMHSSVDAQLVRKRFGSWRSGLQRAGLQLVNHGRRYSDEECFENLLAVWTHYGRSPQYQEMKLPPSMVGPKAYIGRWKTWNRTLQAFVDRVNLETDSPPTEVRPKRPFVERTEKPKPVGEEDRHKIKLGLRYKVLNRDNFKCVLCGRSPATDHACRLHVDHVIPWSKGGKTIIDNLRTLCEQCNLGRGNQLDT